MEWLRKSRAKCLPMSRRSNGLFDQRAREAQPLIGALRQSKATVSGKNNEDLSEHYQSWPDEAKADAGVMIGTDHDQLSTSAAA